MIEKDGLASVRQAARTYLEQLRPIDQVGLVSFGDVVSVEQPLTSDRGLVSRELGRIQASRGTRLYDGLLRGTAEAASAPRSTRAVVVISGGPDTGSTADLAEAVALAQRAGVALYTVAYGSAAPSEVLEQSPRAQAADFSAPSVAEISSRPCLRSGGRCRASTSSRGRAARRRRPAVGHGPARVGRTSATEAVGAVWVSRSERLGRRSGPGQQRPGRPRCCCPAQPSEVGVLAAGLLGGLGVAVLYADWSSAQ